MAKASRLEIARRMEALRPLLLDGLTTAEIRRFTLTQTDWGARVSEAQLKRYLARTRAEITAAGQVDLAHEFAKAKLRNERALSRAAAASDLATYLRANRDQCRLLGLGPQLAEVALDAAAARRALEAEVAAAIAAGWEDGEDSRSGKEEDAGEQGQPEELG